MTYPKIRRLTTYLVLSFLAHILAFYAWRLCGTYDFSKPISLSSSVLVELVNPADSDSPETINEKQETENPDQLKEESSVDNNLTPQLKNDSRPAPEAFEQSPQTPELSEPSLKEIREISQSTPNNKEASVNPAYESNPGEAFPDNKSLLSTPSDFLATKNEKLTYLVSMIGLPVGSAELEAKNENGEIWITLRVKSNTAISSIYPVDNSVETRHIAGRFILAKIKQREGTYNSDEWFTINLYRKRVSWFDNIGGRSLTVQVPTDEVLDTLSGIYLLRNRQLEIGKTEMLHIFDSETYAEVPVEILRRETVMLPNLTSVETLVVQPLQKTAGIFRRTGEIMIWMTDDANKVPVRIETSVSFGKVTIELISAESIPHKDAVKNNE